MTVAQEAALLHTLAVQVSKLGRTSQLTTSTVGDNPTSTVGSALADAADTTAALPELTDTVSVSSDFADALSDVLSESDESLDAALEDAAQDLADAQEQLDAAQEQIDDAFLQIGNASSDAQAAGQAASAAQQAADTATSNASTAQQQADSAAQAAAAAAGVAAGKGKTIVQVSAPTGANADPANFWINISPDANGNPKNIPNRYNADTGKWEPVTDQKAIDAAAAAATAQTTAANAATAASSAQTAASNAQQTAGTAASNAQAAIVAAGQAQSSADGKALILFGSTAPTGTAPQGSTWFQVDGSGNVTAQWQQTAASVTGSTWTPRQLTSDVIAGLDVGKLTAGTAAIATAVVQKIAAGTANIQTANVANLFVTAGATMSSAVIETLYAQVVKAHQITSDMIAAGAIDGITITGATIRTAATGSRISLAGSTMLAYSTDASNVTSEFFRVSTAGGGLIQMSQANTGSVTVKGSTWNGGGIVFTNSQFAASTTANPNPLAAPGIGWFLPTAGATDPTPFIVYGSPAPGSGRGNSYTGMGITQDGNVLINGGNNGGTLQSSFWATANGAYLTSKNFGYDQSYIAVGKDDYGLGPQYLGGLYLYASKGSNLDEISMYQTGVTVSTTNQSTGAQAILGTNNAGNVTLKALSATGSSTSTQIAMNSNGAMNIYSYDSAGNATGLQLRPGTGQGASTFVGSLAFSSQVLVPGNYGATVTGRAMVMRSDGLIGYTPSTRRDKYDVQDFIVDDARAAVLMGITSKTFLANWDFRKRPQRQGGFMAEDFHENGLTEWVDYGADEDYEMTDVVEGLSYDRIPAILWAWNQRLQRQVDELRSERTAA